MFRALGSLLPDAARRLGVRSQVEASQVVAAANKLLQAQQPASEAAAFRDGYVVVRIGHPAEASLLRHREAELLGTLRRQFPVAIFRGLRFRARR